MSVYRSPLYQLQKTPDMNLPVGYFRFHRNRYLNYQLNRWHSLGLLDHQTIKQLAKSIRRLDDHRFVFLRAGERAALENRMREAAFCYRAAEALTVPGSVDSMHCYDKFITHFYQAFASNYLRRNWIKYDGAWLPANEILPEGRPVRGTILLHGGLDTLMEEYYCFWKYFTHFGFRVIAFEGPGQGAAWRNHNLELTREWERPVAAVLDHFKLTDVTLIGLSTGGYWALRAAAYEKRIKRVVTAGVPNHWPELGALGCRWTRKKLLKCPKLSNRILRSWMMTSASAQVFIKRLQALSRQNRPIDCLRWLEQFSFDTLDTDMITQDVLLAGGARDWWLPSGNIVVQKQAFTQARSAGYRLFTKAERAAHHAQIGNMNLLLQVLFDWINQVEKATHMY